MPDNLIHLQLRRELGLGGAILMGLGSILGTGIFVSLGLATQIAGTSVLIAIAIAALLAICNGLNSAQLAANHPVSGGAYEYGYRYLNRTLGFIAGWVFLLAKSASAATAALGFSGYLLYAVGGNLAWRSPLALLAVFIFTALTLLGIRRTNTINAILVSVTLLSLMGFVAWCIPVAIASPPHDQILNSLLLVSPTSILQATALMFVAYTGYGRIATMGEEVKNPRKTIPLAMIICLGLTLCIYLAIAAAGLSAIGTDAFNPSPTAPFQTAPLAMVIDQVSGKLGVQMITLGAITAMLGVLLNLILGLSRVVMAMGRRGDLPRSFSTLNTEQTSPTGATIVTGIAIALLVLSNNVKATWSFSAFCVLIYYAITSLAALRLSREERLYPQWFAWAGLAACLFLAFWVDIGVWSVGLALIAIGLVWHRFRRR